MDSLRSLTQTDKLNPLNSRLKEIAHETKPLPYAGIDVGAYELVLVIQPLPPQTFKNTSSDRKRLINKLAKLLGISVCL